MYTQSVQVHVYIYVWHGGGPGQPLGDVQTDVHIVPVDSESLVRKLTVFVQFHW